jgi:hypothetical protein
MAFVGAEERPAARQLGCEPERMLDWDERVAQAVPQVHVGLHLGEGEAPRTRAGQVVVDHPAHAAGRGLEEACAGRHPLVRGQDELPLEDAQASAPQASQGGGDPNEPYVAWALAELVEAARGPETASAAPKRCAGSPRGPVLAHRLGTRDPGALARAAIQRARPPNASTAM